MNVSFPIKTLKNHPKGLFVLFFAELWERFSYYGMRAILVLYLVSSDKASNPGLNWSNADALSFYGWYTALVYIACIPGGILSDKYLGKINSVIIGGTFLCVGHIILSFQNIIFFYTGIISIIIGVGLLKPNISSLVGDLYKKNDLKRDQGFTIFYIGINFGAFFSSIIVGWVGEVYGWHYGFSIAGFGMILGQLIFIKGRKNLREKAGTYKNIINKKISLIEFDRIKVLTVSFLIIIIFWAAFEQAGGLMNLYAFEKTDRTVSWLGDFEIPASWFQSINPLLIILLGIFISKFWIKVASNNSQISSIFKMLTGLIIMGSGFIFMFFASLEYEKNIAIYGNGYSSMHWIFLAYLFITIGELCASPVILSFITKLSPTRYISTIMGLYFASVGLGNMLAGKIGQYSNSFGEKETFIGITIFCTLVSSVIFLFLKKLNNLTHKADI
ncbi:MAG: MFS transporter [Candidatus Pelagibacter sp.]|nr:MFS transporter [Candidatus Pelagibacter sp.]|tara:strand:- start:1690 stop:3021 length:1332 start_codon:yes stop_codon:yes gene_type:complete